MALRDRIRDWVVVQGKSQRSAARKFRVARETVAKLLEEGAEEERRMQQRPTPRRDAAMPYIEKWLAENERLRRVAPKQQWTGVRMWKELQRLGIPIAQSTVALFIRTSKKETQAAFVPLVFGAGERAEFDFGYTVVTLAGVEQRVPFLAGRLRYSGACYVECFPTERQECFLQGQQHAFWFWGGVPRRVVYDNLKPAVLKILQGHQRREQEAFTHFKSVYGFEAVFANPAAGWEKGSVENLVGYARRQFLVPIPQYPDLMTLNAALVEACLVDQQRIMAGREEPIAIRYAEEQARLLPLPTHPLELGIVQEVLVRKTSHVRFQTNNYSVPVRYVGWRLTVRADPSWVRIFSGETMIAEHARSYERGQAVEDFRHYVPILLERPFAIPNASPLRDLPPEWEAYRRELVARSPEGNREFARMLALCVSHGFAEVTAALERAAASGLYSLEAIRTVLEPEQQPEPLDPGRYPQYQHPQPTPNLAQYNALLGGTR